MLGCSGQFASSCQTTTTNSCLNGGQETQILLPSGGVKMALQHLWISSVRLFGPGLFGWLVQRFSQQVNCHSVYRRTTKQWKYWAGLHHHWIIVTEEQNPKSRFRASGLSNAYCNSPEQIVFSFFLFVYLCIYFFTEHKLLQLLKAQGFLFWRNFCWVWLNIGASLCYLSDNQIYAAISFSCLPVCETFGLSLIRLILCFAALFVLLYPIIFFSTDIPLHHQTSNEVFCYIKLMAGEDRERKALKMLGTKQSILHNNKSW